jgi:hypothetical protein
MADPHRTRACVLPECCDEEFAFFLTGAGTLSRSLGVEALAAYAGGSEQSTSWCLLGNRRIFTRYFLVGAAAAYDRAFFMITGKSLAFLFVLVGFRTT